MNKKLCLVFLFSFFSVVQLFAGSITLKSGQQIEGEILEKKKDSVKIKAYGVDLIYYMEDIDKIDGQQVLAPVPLEAPAARQEVKEEAKQVIVVEPASTTESSSIQQQPVSFAKEKSRKAMPSKMEMGVLLVVMAIAVFVGLLFYVYISYCLFLIARKTDQGPLWWAWVPILNLILMLKIAGLSYYWLGGFLLGLIPIVGNIFVLAISAYIWYKIALVRNKPGWLGILACLPIVNLVIIGYLAFSD